MNVQFAKAVRGLLWADGAVRAAIPGGITPDRIPQGSASPAAKYTNVTGTAFGSLTDCDDNQLKQCSLELWVRCDTVDQDQAVQTAIEAVIGAHKIRVKVGTTTLSNLVISDPSTEWEDPNDGSDDLLRNIVFTISAWAYSD